MGIKNELLSENFNLTDIEKGNDIVIEEEGTKFVLTSASNQKNNINNKNTTNINLGECETKLRNKYNITKDLYILKIDKEIEGLKVPKIEYEVYTIFENNKLEQLDLSVCEGNKIDIYIPYNLSKDDYDKYDLKSGYFNDICYSYTSDNGLDVSLQDRKNEYVDKNNSLCEENCDFDGYDYEIGKVICSCLTKIKMPFISEISFDKNKVIEKFKDIKSISNIFVLKCYYLIINKKGIIKNIGFFTLCPVIFFYFISIFIFRCKEVKKIYKMINVIIDTKKNNRKDIIKVKKRKKSSKAKGQPPQKKTRKKNIISNNLTLGNKKGKTIQNKKTTGASENCQKRIKFKKSPEINLDNNNKKVKKSNLLYNATELNLMSYEKAKKYDERIFCQYYLNLLYYKNIILFTFYLSNDYNSRLLKINIFLYTFVIHFGVNALFFTDSTMHQIYEDKGSFNFIYQLPQILYSSFISMILDKILEILALSENDILDLKSTNKNIEVESKNIKSKIKIKFILFFIFSLILLIFFWIYLSCFCIVYPNTQIYLLKDTLISLGTSLLTPFVINLFPGMFRIPALKAKDKECLYNFSKIIQIF